MGDTSEQLGPDLAENRRHCARHFAQSLNPAGVERLVSDAAAIEAFLEGPKETLPAPVLRVSDLAFVAEVARKSKLGVRIEIDPAGFSVVSCNGGLGYVQSVSFSEFAASAGHAIVDRIASAALALSSADGQA